MHIARCGRISNAMVLETAKLAYMWMVLVTTYNIIITFHTIVVYSNKEFMNAMKPAKIKWWLECSPTAHELSGPGPNVEGVVKRDILWYMHVWENLFIHQLISLRILVTQTRTDCTLLRILLYQQLRIYK